MSGIGNALTQLRQMFTSKDVGTDALPQNRPPEQNTLAKEAEQWLNSVWIKIRQSYLIYHQAIWEAYLYKVGQMWIEWDNTRRLWDVMKMQDDWVPQPRINQYAPAIDAITSNFNAIPEIESVPKESVGDMDDQKRFGISEVATILGHHFLCENGLKGDFKSSESKVGVAGQIFVMNGCFFTYVYPHKISTKQVPRVAPQEVIKAHCPQCDYYGESGPDPLACPQCGNPVQAQKSTEMQPQLDEQQQPIIDDIDEYEARCRIINSLFAYPRPGATAMDTTPYFFWPERFTLDEIKELWNYDATADNDNPDSFNVVLEHALNYYYLGFQGGYAKSEDAALVIQCFVQPGKMGKFPDGLYGVFIGGKMIHAETWPFGEDHPLTKAGYQQIPTLFFDRSVAFDLVAVQREARDYHSIIKLHTMTGAVEPIVVDHNTLVSEITGRGDKTIEITMLGPGGLQPYRLKHEVLDPEVYEMLEKFERYFENISGAAQVFKGEQPGSVTAASAINELRSQAEQMFSQPVANWNAAWKETVRKAVKLMQRKYSLQQLASIVGQDKIDQVNDFKNCDLDKEVEFMSTAHGLPRTRDEQRQEMMALFDRGALDINDINVRQKAFELFGETGMLQSFNADATRARLENKNIKKGVPPNFMPEFEDLTVHYGEHVKQIKSLDFDRWPQPAQQMMIEHALQTKQAMAMQNAPPPMATSKSNGQPPPLPVPPQSAGAPPA